MNSPIEPYRQIKTGESPKICFSPDCKILVSKCFEDPQIRLHNLQNGKQCGTIPQSINYREFDVHPAGKTIVEVDKQNVDKYIVEYDCTTLGQVFKIPMYSNQDNTPLNTPPIVKYAFNNVIAFTTAKGQIEMCESRTGKKIQDLTIKTNKIIDSFDVERCGETMLVNNYEQLSIWDVRKLNQPVLTFRNQQYIDDMNTFIKKQMGEAKAFENREQARWLKICMHEQYVEEKQAFRKKQQEDMENFKNQYQVEELQRFKACKFHPEFEGIAVIRSHIFCLWNIKTGQKDYQPPYPSHKSAYCISPNFVFETGTPNVIFTQSGQIYSYNTYNKQNNYLITTPHLMGSMDISSNKHIAIGCYAGDVYIYKLNNSN